MKGIDKLNQANSESKIPELEESCGKLLRCVQEHFAYNNTGGIPNIIDVNYFFYTKQEFTVDNPINYTIIANTNIPIYSQMYFLISPYDTGNTAKEILKHPPLDVLAQAKQSNAMIQLDRVSLTQFQKRGYWTDPLETHVRLVGMVIQNNGNASLLDETPTLFSVYPYDVKLQSDTNLAMLKQSVETSKTNNIVEGLTWVGVTAVPILLGTDILLRLYLDVYYYDKMNK